MTELDDKNLIKTYVIKQRRIIEIAFRVKKVYSMQIEKYIKNKAWDSLPLAAFNIMKDSFIPFIRHRVSKAVLKLVNEEHDPSVPLKETISTFVTLGYPDVDIKL